MLANRAYEALTPGVHLERRPAAYQRHPGRRNPGLGPARHPAKPRAATAVALVDDVLRLLLTPRRFLGSGHAERVAPSPAALLTGQSHAPGLDWLGLSDPLRNGPFRALALRRRGIPNAPRSRDRPPCGRLPKKALF